MAPGERREILIDLSEGEEVTITAGQSAGLWIDYVVFLNLLTYYCNTNVLTIKPTGLMSLVTDKVPQQLVVDDTQITTSIQPRTIHYKTVLLVLIMRVGSYQGSILSVNKMAGNVG